MEKERNISGEIKPPRFAERFHIHPNLAAGAFVAVVGSIAIAEPFYLEVFNKPFYWAFGTVALGLSVVNYLIYKEDKRQC